MTSKIQLNLILVCILIITSFICTSCADQKQDKNDKHFFHYNQASGISSLDPAFAKDQANIWVVNQIYNGLVQLDEELNVSPSIASDWEISTDGLTYTFNLRNDVYFHDNPCFEDGKGRKLVASDVAYSLNRIIDPDVASPGSWIFSDNIDPEDPFKALSDQRFQIKLKKPFRPLMSILTMQYCSILPKEAIDRYGQEFRSNPVGTGPFVFRSWDEEVSLNMLRNPNYFERQGEVQLPYLDGVRISFIENMRTVFMQFVKGKIDFISGIDASYANDVLTKSGELTPAFTDKIKLYKMPYLNTEYLGILMDDSKLQLESNPLRNPLVRKAINYGFDRKEMIRFLRNNIGRPANSGFVPAGLPSFDSEKVPGYTYQPQKSKQLLAEAGFPNGKGLPEIKLFTNNSYENIGIFIANQLGQIGLNVKLELTPPSFLRERMANSEATFFRGSWIADYPDAESYLAMFYGKNSAPPNYTRFNNRTFDALYEQALLENDNEKRYELYREMDRMIIEEAPVVPLYYDEVVRLVNKNVEGLEPNALNLLVLKDVKKR